MERNILPVGPLMKEHRTIERMVNLINEKISEFRNSNEIDPAFISSAVDFLSVYADKCHHGKEEDILFERLKQKPLSTAHSNTIERLIEEHKFSRKTVSELNKVTNDYMKGDSSTLKIILEKMQDLADLYPQHIKTEDKEFFLPSMNYFDKNERDRMVEDFYNFDVNLLQNQYKNMVSNLEAKRIHINK